MPAPVDQRSPPGGWQQVSSVVKWGYVTPATAQTAWTWVWWLLTKLPYGEKQAEWLQLRHAINLHKVMCGHC